MGAENSNLRSIESLNSSLTEIEKRMFYLEGVKFHHERTGAIDDSLLIAGKLIRCNIRVELLIGPVIGIIGCDFARIVVETELQEELTLNIFEVQRLQFDTPSFRYTVPVRTNNGIPTSTTLQNLTANTFYFVYIGGVSSNSTLNNYALFRTLPTNPDYIRTLYLNNSRVDSNAVSNTSLWTDVNTRCLDLFTIKEHQNKSGPAHLIIHTGNLLSVDHILHEKYAQVVDHLVSHNSSEGFVLASLAEAETQIRALYRKALNSPSVRQIGRHCGCIFLAGDGETGRGFSAQFNADETEAASPQYELKMQLLGMFMRMARRVCWSYLRQAWDVNYASLAADDKEREFFHQAILLTRMSIANRHRMQRSLADCLENTKRDFGTEFHAYKEILTSSDALKTDLKTLDQTLRQLSVKSSEYNTNHELHPNGGALHLGAMTVLLVEAGWGVVSEDGSVSLKLVSAVNIHQQIFDDLQIVLSNHQLDNVRHSVILATSTTLTAQETLEMRHYSLNRNQYSLSRNDVAPFTFADIDVRKLLETLTLWQRQSTSYSVLLVEASNHQYAARGVIHTIFDPDQATMAGLQFLRTGCMELPSSISWRDFDRFFLKHEDSETRPDTPKHSDSVEYRGDSFWDVVFLPRAALSLDSSSDNGDNALTDGTRLMQMECVIRESESTAGGSISFGPSVGRVTPTSAEIFIEFTASGDQKVLCVDQMSGDEHLSVKFATAGRPVCFQFDHLQANTSYDILTTRSGALPVCAGAFTTPKAIELFERLEDVVDDAHTLRILRENGSTKELSPVATQQLVMFQSVTLLLMGTQKSIVDKPPAEVLPPSTVVPSAASTRAPTPLAASRATISSRPGTSDNRLTGQSISSKQAVAGSVAPSVSVSVSRPPTAASVVEPIITQRAIATHLVKDVLSQGWSGVDLTISFGSNVNWSTVVEPVILLLSKAEGEVLSAFKTNQSVLIGSYVNEAENVLRDAHRLNWSKCAEAGHNTGSHLTVASPLVEFLSAFEALSASSKGLSQYVFEQLNFLFDKVHSEYGTLYGRQLHSGPGPAHANHTHFLADNSILIFEIQPVLNNNAVSPSHAFETQLYFLSRELSSFGSGAARSDSRVLTLVVTSPLPVVTEDEAAAEMSFNGSVEDSRQHFAFTIAQTLQLLDLVTSWVEVSSECRRCVLLCGGVDTGFTTTIDVRTQSADAPSTPLSHNASTRSLNRSGKNSRHASRTHKGGISITQICCGFGTGSTDSHQLRSDGQLNSNTRKFSFTHTMHSTGCGVLEIPVVTTKPRDIIYAMQPLEQHSAMLFETQVFKRPHFPVSPLSLQLQDCLEFLYLHSIPPGCVHDKVPDKAFAFLQQIKAFVASVAQKEQDVFKKCHALYCSSNTLSEGRGDVEATFVALNHWLISRLQLRTQKVCKQPSRFVIRVVWHFVSKLFAPPPATAAPTVVSATDVGVSSVASRNKVHLLAVLFRTDYAQFTRFLLTTIETQLFAEYLAATFSDEVNN